MVNEDDVFLKAKMPKLRVFPALAGAWQDEPVGALPTEKKLEKPKCPLVMEGYLEVVGDDCEFVAGVFRAGPRHHQRMAVAARKARRISSRVG